MTRRKHLKQSEVRTLPNVFHSKQPGLDKLIRTYFNNNNPFTLELGCGNGEYSNTLAQKHPDRNFLGIDRAGARIWAASKASLNLNLHNTAFVITYVEKLLEIFNQPVVDEIWIPYPNPLPHRRKMKKILTNPAFLEIYKKILRPDGIIHLKTDDDFLYEYALQIIEEMKMTIRFSTNNLTPESGAPQDALIVTRFEQDHLFAGKTIKYLSFSF
ncbi:MAG TPA: tRNA (guanosine(46)-N7)-methyltransferase TrmB [Ignavibacteriaceae bacterium]|nr:tRNA (guanosine(46)-N7)-methyltransferase TrmB [Ignavibacteriaceae bacterium]